MQPAGILALGQPAAAAAARLARDLLTIAEAGTSDDDDGGAKVGKLRSQAEARMGQLQQLSLNLDRIALGLNQALAEVRTLRMRQSAQPPLMDGILRDPILGLLSGRIIHLEACRQGVLCSRALLLELVTTERLSADQLLMTDDVAEVLALRQARMLMLAERARRTSAMAEEMDAAVQGLG